MNDPLPVVNSDSSVATDTCPLPGYVTEYTVNCVKTHIFYLSFKFHKVLQGHYSGEVDNIYSTLP